MLVLLNLVLPLFCISFVSGPRSGGEGLGKPPGAPGCLQASAPGLAGRQGVGAWPPPPILPWPEAHPRR